MWKLQSSILEVKLPVSIDIICYLWEVYVASNNTGFYSVQFENVSYQNLM